MMNANPIEKYHVKRITTDESYWPFHVHLDAQHRVPESAASELRALGFARSLVALSCLVTAQGLGPNSKVFEAMYAEAEPDNWTVKTASRAICQRAYAGACQVLKKYDIQGYVEAETVHRDLALKSACKPFDDESFDRLISRREGMREVGTEKPGLAYSDSDGGMRLLPFVVNQRPLNEAFGETAPVFEFHLTINFDAVENPEITKLLQEMGLLGYEVKKVGVFPDGTFLRDVDGQVKIITERPLTLRLGHPKVFENKSRSYQSEFSDFLNVTKGFVDLIGALGGFRSPEPLRGGAVVHPVTFKIESLHGFFSNVSSIELLPPVFENVVVGDRAAVDLSARQNLNSFLNYLDRANPNSLSGPRTQEEMR